MAEFVLRFLLLIDAIFFSEIFVSYLNDVLITLII